MSYTDTQLKAGKQWIDIHFPDTTEVDLTYLTLRFNMPKTTEAYIRTNWFRNNFVKKPFKKSEIYSLNESSSSSSSLYTEKSLSSFEV